MKSMHVSCCRNHDESIILFGMRSESQHIGTWRHTSRCMTQALTASRAGESLLRVGIQHPGFRVQYSNHPGFRVQYNICNGRL
jgi:hypothetical protein